MDDNKEKWIEEVFQSMQKSQRAQVRPELFQNVKKEIAAQSIKIIPLPLLKKYAAVAAVVLLVNSSVLLYYDISEKVSREDIATLEPYKDQLITTYLIYE